MTMPNTPQIELTDYSAVRSALVERSEIALLDVREEDPHAQCHPLFAANFPVSRLEADAYALLPRRDVWIVTFDEGDDPVEQSDAMLAAQRLAKLGYVNVSVFQGGDVF